MLKTRHLIGIFLPVLIITALIVFIRVIQYQPLFPSAEEYKKQSTEQAYTIPIFADDPIIGDRQAAAAIVVFSDFGCPNCGEEFALWEQIIKQYPKKMKIIWKGLPVARIPYSTELANQYAYCANQQGKFNEFANLAFANSDNLSPTIVEGLARTAELDQEKLQTCLNSGAADIYSQKVELLATALNIQSVPTLFLNNKQIEPPRILEGWKTLLGL